jgi:tetratricopeptide (TPR) repeat protein
LISILFVVGIAPVQADDLEEIRDLADSGRTYEALTRLEPLLETEPDRVQSLMLKGILLTRLGRVDEAKEIFLGLIKSSPELPEPYINLATLYAGAGDYDRAVRILKRALATHPSYQAAYENLTKVYGKLASEAYRRALGDEAETDGEAVRPPRNPFDRLAGRSLNKRRLPRWQRPAISSSRPRSRRSRRSSPRPRLRQIPTLTSRRHPISNRSRGWSTNGPWRGPSSG